MSPAIQDGDRISVEPVPPDALRRGDVVLYEARDALVAHRVSRTPRREVGETSFETRADNSPLAVHEVARASILGRVVAVERAEGRKPFGLVHLASGLKRLLLRLRRWRGCPSA